MLSELRVRFFREIESRTEDGWVSSGMKEGIEVFQKKVEGAALNMVLGRGIANVPVRAVWDIISQVQRKAEWDKLFKSGNLLESLDADTGMIDVFLHDGTNNWLTLQKFTTTSTTVCGRQHRGTLC